MSTTRPWAFRAFERLGLDAALAGDLLEERAQGRSAVWYWRQVLSAVAMGIWTQIRNHKVLALRAIATGCAVNSAWLYLWSHFLPIGVPAIPKTLESIVSPSLILLTQAATGWIVARTHRAHAIPMVTLFAAWLVFWYLAGTFSEAERLLVNSIDQPRFRPYLTWYFVPVACEVVGLLLGGLIGTSPVRAKDPTPQL